MSKDNKPTATASAETPVQEEATVTPIKSRVAHFGNELKLNTPWVTWYPGLAVIGKIMRIFEHNGTYGPKDNLEIKLLEGVTFTNADGEVIQLEEGDRINVGKVAGLTAVFSLGLDYNVCIECVGKKKLEGRKEPAWDFKVSYQKSK